MDTATIAYAAFFLNLQLILGFHKRYFRSIAMPSEAMSLFKTFCVMIKERAIRKLVSNRLISQLNIADCIQLILHFISGLLVLFPIYTEKYPVVVRIMGALINACWLVTFPILCLLAFTRILIILRYVSPYKTNPALRVFNIIGFFMGGIVLVLGIIGMHFTFIDLHWEYDVEKPFAHLVRCMELYAFLPCIVLSYFAYVALTIHIRTTRSAAQNTSLPRFENQIFLHYFIVCSFVISLVICWNVSAMFGLSSRLQDFIMNCCWIISCYINPLAVMLFNRTTRAAVLAFFGLRKRSQLLVASTSMPPRHQASY
ncbi:hypothetical protein Y032_0006g2832 [Ancylostoma ceylanicum]|nr:hypothetical protein Y032_0006g2832 [Ancylostoma ceylanicum]